MVGQPEGTRLISRGDQGPDRYAYGSIKYESLEPQASRCLCTKRDTIIVSVVAIGVCILITISLALGLPKIREKRLEYLDVSFSESSSPLVSFDKAVVVSDGSPCSDIGNDILKNGGTAVDAAIAALFCGGVVNPQSMGFGGGFLMTVFIKQDNKSAVIDAREVAPLNASRDMFEGNWKLSQEGGLSIAVPGELRGYWTAHQNFGKTPWKQLVEPSIQLCTHGFKVSAHLAKNLEKLKTKIMADDSMRKEFFNNETNDLYKEGEILRRPILGITLNEIAAKGADVIYTGDLYQSFLEDIGKCGGIINKTDLESYKVNINPAINVMIDSPEPLMFHTVPPPGSGLILSLILNILSNYNMTSQDFEEVDKAVLQYHRIVEAFKFAFAQRTQLADGEFLNLTELVSTLKSKAFADSLAKQITDEITHPPSFYKPVMDTSDDHGTAHVSVLAENGDAVSVTSTINSHFGSLCLSPSTGIILNNAMDDFSSPNIINYFGVPPSPANYIVPGKRPLTSMCPSIAVNNNGDVQMITGGAGGTRMITSSALAILRTLWLGEDIKKATDAPRIHHQLFPNTIQHEPEFPKLYLDKLKTYGHSVQLDSHASVFLGIVRENGKLKTNVDYRKGGSASGY